MPAALSTARILLLAALVGAPLAFGAVQTWAWAALALLALAALFLWATSAVQCGVLRVLWSPLYLPLALFLALGVIQFAAHLTLDRLGTREALIKLLTGLILFFLGSQLIAARSEKTMAEFGVTVAVFAFSLSLFAILQFFSSHGLIYWAAKSPGWTFGPYVNHNHYAGLMEILIPIAGAYALSRPGIDPLRPLLGFAVLVPITSLLLSGSRGGLISLLAEVLVLAAVLLRRAPLPNRRGLAAAAVLGIVAAALLFFWTDPGHVSRRLATVVGFGECVEPALAERKIVVLDALRIFRDHPWIGTGLGSFSSVYSAYRSFPSDLLWDHVHNDYAEALAETGIVGGILILLSLVVFLRLAFRHIDARLRREVGWIQLGAAIGCCGLLVHSFVDFNLHIPANAAWFAVSAGIAQADVWCVPSEQPG